MPGFFIGYDCSECPFAQKPDKLVGLGYWAGLRFGFNPKVFGIKGVF